MSYVSSISVLAVSAAVLWAASAHADAPAVAPGHEQEAAAPFIREAREHAQANDFDGAAERYKRALAIWSNSQVLFTLAVAENRAGHNAASLGHFRRYLKASDAETEKRIIIQNEFLPKLLKTTGRISLDGAPDAPIALDGVQITEMQGPLVDADPGPHELTAEAKGRQRTWHSSVTVKAGETVTPRFDEMVTPPVPSSVASSKGNSPTDHVASTTRADDEPRPVALGVQVSHSESMVKQADRDCSDVRCKPAFYGVVGIELGAFVGVYAAGAVIWIHGLSEGSDASGHTSGRGGTARVGGMTMLVGGFAGMVGVPIATLEIWQNKLDHAAITVAPAVGPTGNGLLFSGTF